MSHHADHRDSIVELSSILLDYYCEIIPADKPDPATAAFAVPASSKPGHNAASTLTAVKDFLPETSPITLNHNTSARAPIAEEVSPLELYRIAARDRAYGLLSSLTRLGSGWDYPKAWFVLARAYEESKQIEKAKEALWWTVELEDARPIREWKSVNLGGFVL